MNNNINRYSEKCYGCGACVCACSYGAASLRHTVYSTVAIVNEQKCVQCGLCLKACPIGKSPQITEQYYPHVYAARGNNPNEWKSSASGGVFYQLASYIIREGGIVFGAIWQEDFTVQIEEISSFDKLQAALGSKYVESSTERTFIRVKQLLAAGKTVLYSGLPCQIGGLQSYLGHTHPNLITVELVCHGTPSREIFKKYVASLQQKEGCHLQAFNHRYKKEPWTPLTKKYIYIEFQNKHSYVMEAAKDSYINGFINALYYRESCYHCTYAQLPRTADITLGDYTGLGVLSKKQNDYADGASQVLINTPKGSLLYSSIKNKLVFEERELSEALLLNLNLWRPSPKNPCTDSFKNDFATMTWDELSTKYLSQKKQLSSKLKKLMVLIFGEHLSLKIFYILRRRNTPIDKILKGLK